MDPSRYRADLHVHTRFSRWRHLGACNARDSYNEPLEVYRRLRSLGMDFVVISDHDTIDGALDLLCRHPELEPHVIVAEEVETRLPDAGQWLHVNVFDIDEATHRDIRSHAQDVRELVGYLRSRGILHVLNHPFQSYRLQRPPASFMAEILGLFDHFETRNAALPARHNLLVDEMLASAVRQGVRKHGVGGSDAHVMRHLAACHTEAPLASGPGSLPPKRAFLESIAGGRGRAVGHSIGAAALTGAAYRIIGRYYLEFTQARVRRVMRPLNWGAAAVLAPAVLAGLPAFLSLGNALRLEAVTFHVRRALRRMEEEQAPVAELGEPLGDPPG